MMNIQVSASAPVIAPEEIHIRYGLLKTGMLMGKRKLWSVLYACHRSP